MNKESRRGTTSRTERICAFTDGVYAIVITLLVLDLKAPEVPGLTETQILHDLVKQGRNFLAYIISFFVAAWFWYRHHRIFKGLSQCDDKVIALNFVHLLFLTLIPYTASVAGRYHDDQLAVILFLGNLGLSGLSLSVLSQYVVPKTEWHEKEYAEPLINERVFSRHSVAMIAFLGVLASFFSVDAAFYVCFLLPVVLALANRRSP